MSNIFKSAVKFFMILASFYLTTELWATQPEFKPVLSHSLPVTVSGIAVADFNRDGIPDIAATGGESGVLNVMLGIGGGRFLPPVGYSVPDCSLTGIRTADFNHDGAFDLAAACAGQGVVVFMANGDGTFQTPVIYPTQSVFGTLLVAGDYNRDGNIDLVSSGSTGENKGGVAVLLGNGDGTFQLSKQYPAGTLTWSMVSGDLNGDGAPDLVVTRYVENTVGVLLNNGDGTFQPVTNYLMPAVVGGIMLGDTNMDGKLDLLASLANSTVVVALGNGTGGFQPAKTTITGSYGILGLADFNLDGLLDLATSDGAGDIAVWQGIGDATFTAPAVYATTAIPGLAAIADLDGDGYPDMVVPAQQGFDIFLNAGASLPVTLSSTLLTFPVETLNTTSPPQTAKVTNTSSSTLTISSVAISGDFLVKNGCGDTLEPNGSCNLTVQFRPRATGTRKGTVTITDSANGSPQKIQLTGTGD